MSENIKLLTITEYNYLLNSAGSNAATESILVEIPITGWSTESPYTITINVDGIVANYSPIFYLVPAGEEPTEDEIKGTELITDITTEEGSITIEVSEVPTTGFTIALCGFSGKTDFSPADYAELNTQVIRRYLSEQHTITHIKLQEGMSFDGLLFVTEGVHACLYAIHFYCLNNIIEQTLFQKVYGDMALECNVSGTIVNVSNIPYWSTLCFMCSANAGYPDITFE